MIIEFSVSDGGSVLINSDKIVFVQEETREKFACITLDTDARINVRQKFEEIKKRLGMSITPRAETLAIK